MNFFFDSELKHCLFIWVCHSRTNNRKMDGYKRWLRIIYKDEKSSFKELIEKLTSVPIHERKAQIMTTEMYKVSNNCSPHP